MTSDQIDERVLDLFSPPKSVWWVNRSAQSTDAGIVDLRRINSCLWRCLPANLKKKKGNHPERLAWVRSQTLWSIKRLEQRCIIKRVGEDRWRKLGVLEQLAQAGAGAKKRKKKKRRKS